MKILVFTEGTISMYESAFGLSRAKKEFEGIDHLPDNSNMLKDYV